MKEEGNGGFKQKQFQVAQAAYSKGIDFLDRVKEHTEDSRNLKKVLLVNMSVCTNNTKSYGESVRNLTQAIEIDEGNAKAFFLRS